MRSGTRCGGMFEFARRPSRELLLLMLLGGYAWLVVRTAWLSDDAFISLRTAGNFLHGYGLRWNPDERVQTFSHPLWLAFLITAHALSGEPFYATLYLSCAVSVLALCWLVLRAEGGLVERVFALALCCVSKAFVDYSSSGLENPLTHALLALFAIEYLRPVPRPGATSRLGAIAGLVALNRLDTALLVLPALVPVVIAAPRAERVRAAALFGLPLMAWECFSLVYYGFPFPNTAYAKLNLGEVIARTPVSDALRYFRASFVHDPLSLSVIALAAACALARRDRPRVRLLSGALAYLGYVVWIGGDFMQGRFFSAPFFLAIACLATSDWLRDTRVAFATGALAIGLCTLGDLPPPFTSADYGLLDGSSKVFPLNEEGIHEARKEFFQCASLANAAKMTPDHADHPWAGRSHRLRERARHDPSARVQVIDAIGFAGYYAGPNVHVVDRWALADVLLARLPALFGGYGHNPRALPPGYFESLVRRENRIEDPALHRYYEALAAVIRGPLFSARRFAAIWQLNTRALDPLLDRYAYVRGRAIELRTRIVNPGDRPVVASYVWNADKTSGYVLDVRSSRGQSYELAWSVTAHGARLSAPPAVQMASLPALAPAGFFTLSVAFHPALTDLTRDLYELRFYYRRKGDRIVMLRDPWPLSMPDFPHGVFSDDPDATAASIGRVAIRAH